MIKILLIFDQNEGSPRPLNLKASSWVTLFNLQPKEAYTIRNKSPIQRIILQIRFFNMKSNVIGLLDTGHQKILTKKQYFTHER